MKVISFCIYGKDDIYCKGLQRNLDIIQKDLPDYNVFIYVGNDVPQLWVDIYKQYSFVKLFYTELYGHDNMFARFFAIDEPDVELMFCRDTDSRIHERDLWCIRHFQTAEQMFHTTRDHKLHYTLIMAGLWGIKNGCLPYKMADLYNYYNKEKQIINKREYDQHFLRDIIYEFIHDKIIVYTFDESMKMSTQEYIKIIERPVVNGNFCGEVVLFDENGNEYNENHPDNAYRKKNRVKQQFIL